MDDLVRAAGQRVLEQEALERVEPLLEHREARDEGESDGGERHESQQRREGEAAGRAAKTGVARPAATLRTNVMNRGIAVWSFIVLAASQTRAPADYPMREAAEAAAFVVSFDGRADDR